MIDGIVTMVKNNNKRLVEFHFESMVSAPFGRPRYDSYTRCVQ